MSANFLLISQRVLTSFFSYPYAFTISTTIFLLLLPLLLVLTRRKKSPSSAAKNRPPTLQKLPIFGNLFDLGSHPHTTLRNLAQIHGPIMLLHFGNVPVLVVSSPDSASEIMKTHDIIFANRPSLNIWKKLIYDHRDIAAAPYGEYWRQMKSVCVLHLLSNKMVKSFRTIRREETNFMIQKIINNSSSSSSKEEVVINLSEVFVKLTNDVICRVALGKKYRGEEEGNKFKGLLSEFTKLLGVFDIGDYIPWLGWVNYVSGLYARVNKVAKEFDVFLDKVVKEHVDKKKEYRADHHDNHKDFVDVLLEIQKENSIGFSLESVSIKALILDMFAAGTDTTSTILEWAMTELLRNPMVMKKLQNEVKQVTGSKTEVTEDELDQMPYLKAVIKETLRLHTPVPLLVPRKSTQNVTIKSYDVDAGTTVFINASAIGRDSSIWDKPDEFNPEKFLNSSIDFKGHDFELIPFGAGRRACPGILFASIINELALANLVSHFDWGLPGGARGEDLDMNECLGLTMKRKVPLLAVGVPCSSM